MKIEVSMSNGPAAKVEYADDSLEVRDLAVIFGYLLQAVGYHPKAIAAALPIWKISHEIEEKAQKQC